MLNAQTILGSDREEVHGLSSCVPHCAALFVDLTKAFDLVDHALLLQRLKSIGLGNLALSWFKNDLSDRTQCVAVDNYTSSMLRVRKGVPQGSLLAPLISSIFINNLVKMVPRMAALLRAPGKLCSFSYVLFVFLLFYVLDVVSIM